MEGGFALDCSSWAQCGAAVGIREVFNPLNTSDLLSCVAMTHNLCVESLSLFQNMWEEEGERERVSVNAVLSHPSTSPLLSPPSSLPSPSSLLCTVDDSDPGQSSETWGERLVPPCRIYAGKRCSPIRSARVLSKSRRPLLRHYAAVNTHARVCVFALQLPSLQLMHVCVW